MNKLKYKISFTKVLKYLFTILIIYIVYICIKGIFIKSLRTTTKEGLFNASSITTQLLCKNNKCMDGCKKPTKITDQCDISIYRDIENKCYRLCPYICENISSPCISNDCCSGCEKQKIEVPCDNLLSNGADVGISSDGTFAPVFATGYADIQHDPRATQRAINTYNMINDVSNVYNKYSGDILNVNEYECRPNITGTFTECGPEPSMKTKYQ